MPPEENAVEQPNDIYENDFLKIKDTCQCLWRKHRYSFLKRFTLRKPRRETVKKLEKPLEKVNHVIEVLNQLAYSAAIKVIKTARTENECIIKKPTSSGEKEIGHSI